MEREIGTVTKGLVQGLDDLEIRWRVETIQYIVALLRSAGILRRVPETWGDLLSLKLQWETISVTFIMIIIMMEIRERIQTIQTTAQFRRARILRGVLETRRDLLSLSLQWKTTSYRWCEKLAGCIMIIIMIIIVIIIIIIILGPCLRTKKL